MKMREAHIVPLSTQAAALLEELQKHTGARRWLFPEIGRGARCMSENTITVALRRMGYAGDEMTVHGFPRHGLHASR
jgi:integrase